MHTAGLAFRLASFPPPAVIWDEGGITLLDAEGPQTAIATSNTALRVDSAQYDAPTGEPCLEAYRRQQILRIDSTTADSRWPEFAATAAAHGLGSTLSVPLSSAETGSAR